MNVHQFDIVLDVLLFNQTSETLQNLSVEFATIGDLKVVERPSTQNIGPQSFHSIQTTIKVSSADAGVIFGNIIYEGHTASVNNIVILNDIHINIMDYIKPGHCTQSEFRTMWSEFEWENKVNISITWSSLRSFLIYLLKNTNMTCLTTGALQENLSRAWRSPSVMVPVLSSSRVFTSPAASTACRSWPARCAASRGPCPRCRWRRAVRR